jgi:hypothetical protein
VDGYTKTYLPAQVDAGYYLLNSEVTTFTTLNGSMAGGLKKFKKLAAVRVYGNSAVQTHHYALTSHENADLVVQMPASMSGYQKTDITSMDLDK